MKCPRSLLPPTMVAKIHREHLKIIENDDEKIINFVEAA